LDDTFWFIGKLLVCKLFSSNKHSKIFCNSKVGDVIVGGVWMARYESLTAGISPDLYKRLQTEYASNEGNFRHLFDELQVKQLLFD